LYKNILIPTDGSELANKAVKPLLAKENGARITTVTVTEPFHLFSVAMSQIEYTRSEYKKRTRWPSSCARRRCGCSQERRCRLRHTTFRARACVPSDHRCRCVERMRPDRNGLALPSRRLSGGARQRDGQGANPLEDPRPCLSLKRNQAKMAEAPFGVLCRNCVATTGITALFLCEATL
jgi:hypothetical protein